MEEDDGLSEMIHDNRATADEIAKEEPVKRDAAKVERRALKKEESV